MWVEEMDGQNDDAPRNGPATGSIPPDRKLTEKEAFRCLVLAIKHTPEDHHDWDELMRYAKRVGLEEE